MVPSPLDSAFALASALVIATSMKTSIVSSNQYVSSFSAILSH
jgi:hypothetical protein